MMFWLGRFSDDVRVWGWSQPIDATLYLKGEMECDDTA